MVKYVYSLPSPEVAKRDVSNGLNHVVVMLAKYLPEFGFQCIETAENAALFTPHAGNGRGNCDVAFCHGLYPTGMPDMKRDRAAYTVNRNVIEDLKIARQIIVPSQWVADMLKRDMHVSPNVVGWGIEWDWWQPESLKKYNYVLWNKNRSGDVCDPKPMNALAVLAPDVPFFSTFGIPDRNVQIIGTKSFMDMAQLVKRCGVYLATTKETFGIGTLEALASGTPVLGYNWGGTADLIQHRVNGFLVEPGDIEGLKVGLEYIMNPDHYQILSDNARATAKVYDWMTVTERVAGIFNLAMEPLPDPLISVIIPCYNYADYIRDAVHSVMTQECRYPFELIVVNDGSTDNSREVIDELANNYGFRVIHQENTGVAHARNHGIEAAKGAFISCMDADDMMAQEFLNVCADALLHDRRVGIAFTSLVFMGSETIGGWPDGYDYEMQLQGQNRIPSLCMFRKEGWRRIGGFRQKYAPAEDAEFWLRFLSRGFTATHASRQPLFQYRVHSGSATDNLRAQKRQEPNWTDDKPWKLGGPRPFACDGMPKEGSWPVHNYDQPVVSVIIPVGPYHTDIVKDALDSVEAQLFWNWEAIVINDSGQPLDLEDGWPYAKVHDVDFSNVSMARNYGIDLAKGEFLIFLDADDIILPEFMNKTLHRFRETGHYVYTDWFQITEQGRVEVAQAMDNASETIFRDEFKHLNCCLIPTSVVRQIGGFDVTMTTWEDVDLYMRLAIAGLCGTRIPEPLMRYNYRSGRLRREGYDTINEQKDRLRVKYATYMKGQDKIVCGCANVKQNKGKGNDEVDKGDRVLIQYHGAVAKVVVRGLVTGQNYHRHCHGDIFEVYRKDQQAMPDTFVPVANYGIAEEQHYDIDAPVRVST